MSPEDNPLRYYGSGLLVVVSLLAVGLVAGSFWPVLPALAAVVVTAIAWGWPE